MEIFKKYKESRRKHREMEKISQQINVKLFSENGYVFYTDITSYIESTGKMKGIGLIEDIVLLDNILKEAYDSNWELDERIVRSKYFKNFTFSEQYLVYLFQKRKIRVYDIENNTFENDIEIFEYKYNPAPLIGNHGLIVKVNEVVIKQIILAKY